ncbi:MAG: hypothetical protein DMD81_13225 [Candidatus Rokuibacteriota bacterium]|nr:MAG: hypothetical protein DMD81_13225 [Candidatus Rokubacteria bacterium]
MGANPLSGAQKEADPRDSDPDPGLRHQFADQADARSPRGHPRALPQGLADPVRPGRYQGRRVRRRRERVPGDARRQHDRRVRGRGRGGRGSLLPDRGRGVSRHPSRFRHPLVPARVARRSARSDARGSPEHLRAHRRIRTRGAHARSRPHSERRPSWRSHRHRSRRRPTRADVAREGRLRDRDARGGAGTPERGRVARRQGRRQESPAEGDPLEWSHAPFGADLVDGRIYGRGAADMKSGLAAAMVAAAAIQRSGAGLRGRLVVGALVDEEADMLGARHFATTEIARTLDGAIICEPEQNEICLEQRGVVWARVTLRGRMAHGAMPEAGVNPIQAVGELLRQSRLLERRLRRLCEKSRYLRPPTVTPTVVRSPAHGVAQSNVIPSAAEATLDIRLTPGLDEPTLQEAIETMCRDVASGCPGVTVDWKPVNGYRLATRVEREEPLVAAMTKAVRQATGRAPRFGGVPGSTDGTILRTALGIPIVTCGPGHRLIPHQVDEYVEVRELCDAARIYAAAALNFLQ